MRCFQIVMRRLMRRCPQTGWNNSQRSQWEKNHSFLWRLQKQVRAVLGPVCHSSSQHSSYYWICFPLWRRFPLHNCVLGLGSHLLNFSITFGCHYQEKTVHIRIRSRSRTEQSLRSHRGTPGKRGWVLRSKFPVDQMKGCLIWRHLGNCSPELTQG